MILKCFVCGLDVQVHEIKYHTADRTKVFCGAECSVKHHAEIKEANNGKDEV